MNGTQDYTKMMQELMANFPGDMSSVQDSMKSYAAFGEKMSKVVLDAAEKSTEISSKWATDTLSKLGTVATVKDEPSEYSKSMADFAAAQAESTTETLAAYAEIAKKVQMETVELMLAAGKDAQEDATAALKKAGREFTTAKRAAK